MIEHTHGVSVYANHNLGALAPVRDIVSLVSDRAFSDPE